MRCMVAGTIRKKYNRAGMFSPEGLKPFVFAHRNSIPNISTRGSGYKIYLSMANMATARIRPIKEMYLFSMMNRGC